MAQLRRFLGGWLLALAVMVSAITPHMAAANETPRSSQATKMADDGRAHAVCLPDSMDHHQSDGCAAMMAHCATVLPQPSAIPRLMALQLPTYYAFGTAGWDVLAFFGDTPPPRG